MTKTLLAYFFDQILIDFQNSFTSTLSSELTMK